MGDFYRNLLSHSKLNSAGLLDGRITEEMLAAVVQPFKQEAEEVHTTIVKKVWRDVILPCGPLCWLWATFIIRRALKVGKLHATRNNTKRFRRINQGSTSAAAMQPSNIDKAQEERVKQRQKKRIEVRSSKKSQAETSSKKLPPKN